MMNLIKRFYNKSQLDICHYYEEYIQNLKQEGSLRTADVYSFKEITIFKHTKRKKLDFIPFDSINDAYILENYCLDKGHSNASIGFILGLTIYL
jgi:hypothetical protein